MDQQKIDQLFREKLDGYEVAPAAGSWGKVEKKIGNRHRMFRLYQIAAAVALLIISWVFWPQDEVQKLTPIASDVSYPVLQEGPEFVIPVISTHEKKAEKPKRVKQTHIQLTAGIIEEKNEVAEVVPDQELKIALEEKTAVVIEETGTFEAAEQPLTTEKEERPAEAPIKVDLSRVKITYIASETQKKQEQDSVKGIKKFFALAGKLSPGEVLADIKTAKDDLINGGKKSKGKDRTSL